MTVVEIDARLDAEWENRDAALFVGDLQAVARIDARIDELLDLRLDAHAPA